MEKHWHIGGFTSYLKCYEFDGFDVLFFRNAVDCFHSMSEDTQFMHIDSPSFNSYTSILYHGTNRMSLK